MCQPKMNPIAMAVLASHQPVTDKVAAFALGEFFQAVLKTDGIGELRRIYEAFYLQAHGEHPSLPLDWADTTPDGGRKVTPGVMAATNGR